MTTTSTMKKKNLPKKNVYIAYPQAHGSQIWSDFQRSLMNFSDLAKNDDEKNTGPYFTSIYCDCNDGYGAGGGGGGGGVVVLVVVLVVVAIVVVWWF
ncbi:hypothetical protein PoB_002321000 [Plakobranchus ocellatus]|uniref:Uncharacterized protein n=1 Tax=Plakobranchus ocellatus TaxID=259542 RepID=A0AAV3ZNI8_9GAST|nr:hypothetical protein PoB_002321000 [Plakobranchus ocellatus]